VEELDIARNMFLGMEPIYGKTLGIVNLSTLYQKASEYLKIFQIPLFDYPIILYFVPIKIECQYL